MLAADRFVEAEELVEADSPRTQSKWAGASLDAIAARRATTTKAVAPCLVAKDFETCRRTLDALLETCQSLEPARGEHSANGQAFLLAARELELSRRSSAPDAPEPFTCNSSARIKVAEMVGKTWKAESDETIEAVIGSLGLPEGKCERKANAGWWDDRYCEGMDAFARLATAGRTIVKGRAATEIARNAKEASYDAARTIKDRWTALLGDKWASEMEKRIQSINDANDAAERARQAAEEAAARAKLQACMGECMAMVVSCDNYSDFGTCYPSIMQCCHPARSACQQMCGIVSNW